MTAAITTTTTTKQQQQEQQQANKPMLVMTAEQQKKMPFFAPIRVPFKRRLQTGAVMVWVGAIVIAVLSFLFLCTFKFLWPLAIVYLTWIAMFDKAPECGGRTLPWCRNWKVWNYYAQYFPMTLVKVKKMFVRSFFDNRSNTCRNMH